jgi:hypothetical protein
MDIYATDRPQTLGVREDETFTRHLQERIKGLLSTLGEAHADLSMLGERMFGSSTGQTASGDSKDVAPSVGRAGDIMAMLDRAQTQAARVSTQAHGLNTRI